MRNALITVSNKKNVIKIANFLDKQSFNIYSTGGTYDYLKNNSDVKPRCISDITNFPEILDGRVKTLHPYIFGGLLSNNSNSHLIDMQKYGISLINVLVCNLYPFKNTVKDNKSHNEIIENIDIGGHSLIRAASKNYDNVTVLSNPDDYDLYIKNYNNIDSDSNLEYAKKAFKYISEYDKDIYNYFNNHDINNLEKDNKSIIQNNNPNEQYNEPIKNKYEKFYDMKYGMNPHQPNASVYIKNNIKPFEIINGNIGYINTLDALGSWNLVREVYNSIGKHCSASFKHTIPAGVAIEGELDTVEKEIYGIKSTSSIANSYIRARNIDPLSSFGDFIAVSGKVDKILARYISKFVSDGIIANDYDNDAIDILKKKKKGKYIILKGYDILYNKDIRNIYGCILKQDPNLIKVNKELYDNPVTDNGKRLNINIINDLILSTITLKYTQSNNVALAFNGQVIGVGSGQQNRLECIKLACKKSNYWFLKRSNKVRLFYNLMIDDIDYNTRELLVSKYIDNTLSLGDVRYYFKKDILPYLNREKKQYLETIDNIVMSSDGFIPFEDNIIESYKNGIRYISNPGGSINDNNIIKLCNDKNMTMFNTGLRMFYH